MGRKLKTGNVIKNSGLAGKGTAPKGKKISPPAMPGRGLKLSGEEAPKVRTCAIKETMDSEIEAFGNGLQNGVRSSLKLDVRGHEETVLGMTCSNAGISGEYKITKSKIVGMIDGGNRLGGGEESSGDDESSDVSFSDEYISDNEYISDEEDDVIYEVTFLNYVDKKWKTEKLALMKLSKVAWMLDMIYSLGIDAWHPGMMPYNLASV